MKKLLIGIAIGLVLGWCSIGIVKAKYGKTDKSIGEYATKDRWWENRINLAIRLLQDIERHTRTVATRQY